MNQLRFFLGLGLCTCFVPAAAAQPEVALERAFPYLSFNQPVFLTNAGDGTDRIFVAEQDGIVYVFQNDSTTMRSGLGVFIDLTSTLSRFHNEAGLLGLAFHPQYAENGYVYVYYTRSEPNRSVISRFRADPANPDQIDLSTELVLLEIVQPFLNHQAGMMQFGPEDGYLYVSIGDGGDRLDGQLHPPDSELNGQNRETLLGTIVRLDVDNPSGGLNYGVPPDNPFVGNQEGWREEIWAYGLRNPWRFSLDGPTNRLWVADVGAKAWEEVNLVEKGDNLGWSTTEGTECFREAGCDMSDIRAPLVQEPHVGSCNSITGGYVYRGFRRPELQGAYVYGDYCHGYIRLIRLENGEVAEQRELIDSNLRISSFGVDEQGELYVVNHNGTLARFTRAPTETAIARGGEIPSFRLYASFPNPSTSLTRFRYSLSYPAEVELTVYDVLGRTARSLVSAYQGAGTHSVDWDGTDEAGEPLGAGLYVYRLRVGSRTETRTMVVLR